MNKADPNNVEWPVDNCGEYHVDDYYHGKGKRKKEDELYLASFWVNGDWVWNNEGPKNLARPCKNCESWIYENEYNVFIPNPKPDNKKSVPKKKLSAFD